MRYRIEEDIFDSIEDVIDYIYNDTDMVDDFNEYLDSEGRIEIAGHSYWPSEALKNIDEDLYWEDYNDYIDAQKENDTYELEHIDVGDYLYRMGLEIWVIEDEEEDITEDLEEEPIDLNVNKIAFISLEEENEHWNFLKNWVKENKKPAEEKNEPLFGQMIFGGN